MIVKIILYKYSGIIMTIELIQMKKIIASGFLLLLGSVTSASFAAKDIADIQAIAAEKNMQINVFTCPDTSNNRNCIYVAWDETQAIQGDEGDEACTSEDDFSYLPNAKCVVVETF